MKTLLGMALSAATITAAAQSPGAPAAPAVEVHPVSSVPAVNGSNENFTGVARISAPFKVQAPGRAGGATVSFEARARTAWHTHPLGQTLIVTAGLGLVQQQGQPAQVIRPGDVVTIPPNVRHWHGAGPDDAMTHVAIAEREDGISVRWQDKVSDEDYRAALAGVGLGVSRPRKHPGRSTCADPTSETLSAKQQAIPLIAAFMATSDMPRLNAALNQGLDAGLTVSEAKEVLVQLYAYVGFPKSLNALGELLKVVEARKQRGIQDAPGREPSRPMATGDELLAAGKANQTKISGGPVQGPVFDFAPVINQFLQAHLFGDIFERDNLDWQSRELATVGALAATPGVEAQLRSHMRASMRVGLTAAQLRQLTQVLAERGDSRCRPSAPTKRSRRRLPPHRKDEHEAIPNPADHRPRHDACSPVAAQPAQRCPGNAAGPLVIQAQGSFAVGGTVRRTPGNYDNNKPTAAGQSFHGDHLYAFYQVPQNPKATAHRHAARCLPVGAQLGDHVGRPRGLPDHVPAPRLPGLSRRPAASRTRGQQHRRQRRSSRRPTTSSSSTSSGSASGRTTSTTSSSIASRRRWISSSARSRPTPGLTTPA